jgi:hypothetical protein
VLVERRSSRFCCFAGGTEFSEEAKNTTTKSNAGNRASKGRPNVLHKPLHPSFLPKEIKTNRFKFLHRKQFVSYWRLEFLTLRVLFTSLRKGSLHFK